MHFPSSSELVSARSARRRLLKLTELELLGRLPRSVGGVRSGSAGFVYYLGPLGHRLGVESGWLPDRRWRRSHVPGQLFVQHTLLVSELHTRLVEGDRSGRFELLELTAEPACHRGYAGLAGQQHVLKPDSYVRLGVGEFEDSYFVEIDRGTEGSRTIERQLEAYLDYWRSGQEQRAQSYCQELWMVA